MSVQTSGANVQRMVVTTDELKRLVDSGTKVKLRKVVRPDATVLANYGEDDIAHLDVDPANNPVVAVNYLRDEPVQCISVNHEDHLYITDDFIPTHNTSNIVFLKSTDDTMIETLSKMSGVTHHSYRDSKTVTSDMQGLFNKNSAQISYTLSTKERAVIETNDFYSLAERNSIVLRAGDPPVWNRNETILPMSWRLFSNTIVDPGRDYSLPTVPTMSTASEFDVKANQPDFEKMLMTRLTQAERSQQAMDIYMETHGYTEADVARLDIDESSDDVMELIRSITWEDMGIDPVNSDIDIEAYDFDDVEWDFEPNMEMAEEAARMEERQADWDLKRYAGGMISRADLVTIDHMGGEGSATHNLDREIAMAYKDSLKKFLSHNNGLETFKFTGEDNDTMMSPDGETVYIARTDNTAALRAINDASQDSSTTTYSESKVSDTEIAAEGMYEISDEFYRYLARLETWKGLAGGAFDKEMARIMKRVRF